MKRLLDDVVGRPRVATKRVGDVAGVLAPTGMTEVASFLDAQAPAQSGLGSDAMLTAEFADFLGMDGVGEALVPQPDPIFRERLRRRLWRVFAISHLRGEPEIH